MILKGTCTRTPTSPTGWPAWRSWWQRRSGSGYEYYAITDHAPNLIMQRMTDEKMLAQRAQVRALDASLELLHGTELNIGPDGSVDWEAAGLQAWPGSTCAWPRCTRISSSRGPR